MARIELSEGVTLRGARRILTKRDSMFRITKRHGKLYTIKKVTCSQPNTEAQMECREMLTEANKMVREDMAREGRKEYWTRMAKEMGYKTAVGCARAWYMSEMRGKELMRKNNNGEGKANYGGDKRENCDVNEMENCDKNKSEATEIKTYKERGYGDVIVIEKSWKRALRGTREARRMKGEARRRVEDVEKKELLIL